MGKKKRRRALKIEFDFKQPTAADAKALIEVVGDFFAHCQVLNLSDDLKASAVLGVVGLFLRKADRLDDESIDSFTKAMATTLRMARMMYDDIGMVKREIRHAG